MVRADRIIDGCELLNQNACTLLASSEKNVAIGSLASNYHIRPVNLSSHIHSTAIICLIWNCVLVDHSSHLTAPRAGPRSVKDAAAMLPAWQVS
jgi:hypothetical protein